MAALERHGIIAGSLRALRRPPWLLLVAYPAAWIGLYALATEYWFLPAGLRVAALWLTRPARWPWLALAEGIAIAVVTPIAHVHSTWPAMVGGVVLPWVIYAAAVHEVRRHVQAASREGHAYGAPLTVAAGLLGASFNGLLLTGLRWLDSQSLDDPLRVLLTFVVGDYTGVLSLAPILVLAREHHYAPARLATYLHRGWVLAPLLGVCAATWPALAFPRAYAWVPVSIPLMAVGALCGRRAAVVALTLAFLALAVLAVGAPDWPPQEIQRVITVAGSAALLLGARRDATHMQRDRLSSSIEELHLKTQALRDIAIRLSGQREEESRRIGLELHDQVGQDMTALATRLRLAERTIVDDAARGELQSLQHMVETAHEHLRNVIRHLHPIALERFGLERALAAGPLADIATDAGVAYSCELAGPVDALPLDVATALYRICQEAVTNAVRHGCGGTVLVRLTVVADGDERQIELAIHDREGRIDIPPTSDGLGLQGIRDRANALGATYRFDTLAGTPRHWLQMQLPGTGAAPPRRRDRRGTPAGETDRYADPGEFLVQVGYVQPDGGLG